MPDNDEFMAEALRLAEPGWTVERTRQVADRLRQAYNRGLHAAACLAENWGEQAGGGSGQHGQGYKNLASSIRRKMTTS
jgi:hypothetical protein